MDEAQGRANVPPQRRPKRPKQVVLATDLEEEVTAANTLKRSRKAEGTLKNELVAELTALKRTSLNKAAKSQKRVYRYDSKTGGQITSTSSRRVSAKSNRRCYSERAAEPSGLGDDDMTVTNEGIIAWF